MAAHRYWRIFWLDDASVDKAATARLEMRTAIGGSSACAGGTPLAQSSAGLRPAAHAFDSDPATWWCSEENSPKKLVWLGYDFGPGNAKDVVEVAITASSVDFARAPSAFKVQASDNGVRWFDVWHVSGVAAWAAGDTRAFAKGVDLRSKFADPHRYWRLWILRAGGNYKAIRELELRGSVGGADQTVPGGPATASNVYPGTLATNTIDNSAGTYWETYPESSVPITWQYDFGAATPKIVREFTITASEYPTETPKDFDLQFSDDGVTWITAAAYDGVWPWTVGQQRVLDGAVPIAMAPPATIDTVTPDHGSPLGTTDVTITGLGFTGSTGVLFGATQATNFVVVNDTIINCRAPAHAVGVVDVTVQGPNVTKPAAFTYVWTYTVTPNHGPVAGGTRVRVVRS